MVKASGMPLWAPVFLLKIGPEILSLFTYIEPAYFSDNGISQIQKGGETRDTRGERGERGKEKQEMEDCRELLIVILRPVLLYCWNKYLREIL